MMLEKAGISAAVPVKHINDITECAICNEVFTVPRVLPCVHTFCFECITKWAEDQAKDDKLACPLCRKEFIISVSTTSNGIERGTDLPKNFFVQKVVSARKLSSALSRTDLHCDVCYESSEGGIEEETGATAEKAVAYCVECSQNVCKQCCMYHRKMKTLMDHKLVDLLENQLSHSEMPLLELPEDKCGEHGDKALMLYSLYCHDCNVPTCLMCLITHHKQHNCADIKELADEMRVRMKADIASVSSKVDECRQLLDKLDTSNSEFCRKIEDTAKLVTDTSEKMKQAIDDYKAQLLLLDELESAKKQHEKKVESVCQELETTVLMLEIFKHYSEQLRSKGTSCDVTTSAACLHNRTKELTALKICDGFPDKCLLDVQFTSEFSIDELHRLFGELCIEDVQRPAMQGITLATDTKQLSSFNVLGTLASKNRNIATGITSLGNDIFVVHKNATNIEVYDATTGMLRLQRPLPAGCNRAKRHSLAACCKSNCIYMSAYPDMVYRINLVASEGLTKAWSTARKPSGIAVNGNANLLVTCRDARKIQEFESSGILVREIILPLDMTFPMHAIQLTGDQFGVVHIGLQHRFCVVGSDGRIVGSYGAAPGSGDGQLWMPHCLAPSGSGDAVFIADEENHRILLLNLATLTATPLNIEMHSKFSNSKAGGPLMRPYCIHYDPSRGRLYIAERMCQLRVVVVAIAT